MKSVGTESSTQSFCCCLQRERDVDFLLMAKLVAISTLGNPPRLGEQHCFRRSQVVLSEGHHFCCKRQEAVRLNDVRLGNKVGFDRPRRLSSCIANGSLDGRSFESETNSR